MATDYGVNYNKAYVLVPAQKYGVGEFNGNTKTLFDEHTGNRAVYAIADIIKFGKLPKGARVLQATVKSASLGTTGIFTLGYPANGVDVADPDGFLVVAQGDAGGQAVQASGTGAAIGKKFTAETEVELVFTEASDVGTSKLIQCWVQYILD